MQYTGNSLQYIANLLKLCICVKVRGDRYNMYVDNLPQYINDNVLQIFCFIHNITTVNVIFNMKTY